MRKISSLFLMMFFLLLYSCSNDSVDEDIRWLEPDHVISAKKLYSEYEKNSLRADQKYKGKILLVKGRIFDIGDNFIDGPHIILTAEDSLSFTPIRCRFSKKRKNELLKLSKNDVVFVKCECGQKIINVIELDNCLIVKKIAD